MSLLHSANRSTASSTLVSFDWDYFVHENDSDLVVTGIELWDYVSLQRIETPEIGVVLGSGSADLSVTLTANHQHFWKAYLRDVNDTRRVYSSGGFYFDVVGASVPYEDICASLALGYATSSILGQFFDFSASLSEKFPFAYLYDIQRAISTSASSSRTFPTLTLTTGTSTPLNMTLDFLSEDTVSMFVPDDLRLLLRSLIGIGLWIAFAMLVVTTIKRQF